MEVELVVLSFLAVSLFTFAYSLQNNSQKPQKSKAAGNTYYVSTGGNDANPGSLVLPFGSLAKVASVARSGDTIFVRGGNYTSVVGGVKFSDSNVTLRNYPGEQVVIKMPAGSHNNDWSMFQCWHSPPGTAAANGFEADGIKVLGTDVSPQTLRDGVVSKKGIVLYTDPGQSNATEASGFEVSGCNNWEVSGVDFVGMGYGIFQKKWLYSYAGTGGVNYATHGWYVHNNRVYGYTRESGFQFNGNSNLIENNEIHKVLTYTNSPYGCQGLNLLGHDNIVRNNTIDIYGSPVRCDGILFEWDISDNNLIENNIIYGTIGSSFNVQGGDGNIIRNNQISNGYNVFAPNGSTATSWPCDELAPGNSAASIVPANSPAATDYQYFWNPRDCASRNNQFSGNVVIPPSGVGGNPVPTPTPTKTPSPTPTLTPTHTPSSSPTKTPSPGPSGTGSHTPTPIPTGTAKVGDVNADGLINIVDIGLIIDNYGQRNPSYVKTDVNGDGIVNIIDIGIVIDNYGK
jgi:hypothetical protein